MVNVEVWKELKEELSAKEVTLIAVSKTKPAADIQTLYDIGQRHFGENYVQELVEKQAILPADIYWHYIGHLQGNKVKYIAPFVHLIHAVDSFKLLQEINKHASNNNRIIDVLLQMHIANEETKFGLDEDEINGLLQQYTAQQDKLQHIRICGLMGMATNTDNAKQVAGEFARLSMLFKQLSATVFSQSTFFSICSIGMSADYDLAIRNGGNMVRIGSALFGDRK